VFGDLENSLNDTMEKAISSLRNNLTRIRTGRASASYLDGLSVDYYGTPTPLTQVGQVSSPEARLLQIIPFDKSLISKIEKVIIDANLGVTPSNDGNLIRIPFPALTEDKRKQLVKDVKKVGEDAKVSMRNARRDHNDKVKKMEKSKEISEDDSKKEQGKIQEITDNFIGQVSGIIETKEKDLLTI
jgi:ribosome recycling factor